MELKDFREICKECDAIHNLLKTLKFLELYNLLYPIKGIKILGFPISEISSKEELTYRIKMLEDLLLLEVRVT